MIALGVTFMIYTKVSIHRTEKVVEMRSHDFRLRNGKKDRLTSMEELKGTNPTTIVEGPIGRKKKPTYEGAMTISEGQRAEKNGIAGI